MGNIICGKDIIARRASEKIVIDGKLDEPAWKDAPAVDGFCTIVDGESLPASSRTRVRALWDAECLYIGAEMEDNDIIAFHEENNSRTWEDDVFEMFIKPFRDSPGYYEFHVTPKNTTLQLYFPKAEIKRKLENSIFEGNIKTAVEVRGEINNPGSRDEGWTAEIAIPFSAFHGTAPPPGSGTEWTAAFCRYDYTHNPDSGEETSKELSSSARFRKLDFHLFEDYNKLVFLGDKK